MINYVKWKGYNSSLTVRLIKKTQYKWVNIFPKPVIFFQVELDLSNYVTKGDLKNATGVDTLDFFKKLI